MIALESHMCVRRKNHPVMIQALGLWEHGVSFTSQFAYALMLLGFGREG